MLMRVRVLLLLVSKIEKAEQRPYDEMPQSLLIIRINLKKMYG